MKKYNFLIKKHLYKEYYDNNLSTVQIAKKYECTADIISYRMEKFNIPRRNIYESQLKYKKLLTKKFLIKEYIDNKKSTVQISKELNCSDVTVSNYLKRYNIKRRTQADLQQGQKNLNYIDGRTLKKYYCIEPNCNNEISYNNWRHGSKLCMICSRKGERAYNWNNGSSSEEYGMEFNSSLKEQIRFRNGYKCQFCGCSQLENGRQLDVHHIDYNKKNCKQNNLISLCRSCHTKTNGNRKYWKKYFEKILRRIK